MLKKLFVCVAVCLIPTIVSGQDMEGVKCILNPDVDAKAESSAEHMKGKVYFCCNGCVKKFNADPEKYMAAANHQLVATGQYKQKACPFSGGAVTDGNSVKVGETEVGMCCGNCKGKVEGTEDMAAKVEMVFAKASFEKGFEVAKQEETVDLSKVTCPMMGEEVSTDYSADHMKGKVYFCCDSCVDAFKKEPAKYLVAVNKQLVQTGQYTQKACPFSGGAVTDGNSVKIGDHEIGVCCGNCKSKLEGAEDDDARSEMVFSKEAFEKGFAKTEKK